MIVAHHALTMTAAPTERNISITTSASIERCLQTFWNKVALVEVIINWRVGNTSIQVLVHGAVDERGEPAPSGVTICHRINSLLIASMYGRRGLSSYTESSSASLLYLWIKSEDIEETA